MSTVRDAVQAYQRQDYATARTLCARLGDDPQARFILGLMASYGEGGSADPAAAAGHYRAAAEGGHGGAMFNLAALYAQGRGVPRDHAAAREWYAKAAAAGDPDALFQLGVMEANGEGGPVNLAAAGDWWEKGAAAGEPRSAHFLGRVYAAGDGGRRRDPGRAAYLFFTAWQAGQDEAEQDIIRVREELEAAAEGGSAVAQTALGLILCFGQDDPAAAADWFERAAAQDHPEAVRMLGWLTAEGKGVPRDDVRAAGLYRRAAELGDKFGQFNYGVVLAEGLGVPGRDLDGAIRWLRRAARQGMAEANQPLAELLAERNRDRRDANEAVQRMVTAAAAGPADAEYRLRAGDGSWAVVIADRGAAVSMSGLTMDELVGLPDED